MVWVLGLWSRGWNNKVVVLAADTIVVRTADTKRYIYICVTGTSIRLYNNWFNMTAE